MKKICIDARMLHSSGIGTYLQNVLSGLGALKEFDCKIALLVRPRDIADPRLEKFSKIACPFPIYSLQEQIRLPFLIPKCDIFWSPHYNIPLLPVKALKRLVTVHDVYHLAYFHTLTAPEKLYAKTVFFNVFKKADKVITPSQFSLTEILKYFPQAKDRIEVIHNGVDLAHFFLTEKKNFSEVQNKYSLFKNFFLYVGNIKQHKNLAGLIKAFKSISAGRKDFGLVLVGKREGLKKKVSVLDKIGGYPVRLLENVSNQELRVFYHLAKALVFPSFYEGFGLPAIEAMACGCPVIASRAASLPEVCSDAAYYVDPYDFKSIASAMQELLKDEALRKDLMAKGFERARTFTWNVSVEKHAAVIQNLLESVN